MLRPRFPHAALAAACCFWALSCTGFTSGDDKAVAIEVVSTPDSIGIGDTVFIPVRVLNRAGDSIPGAPVDLVSLNPDTLGIDPASQSVVGVLAGTGRFVAKSGNLPSAVLQIRVQ